MTASSLSVAQRLVRSAGPIQAVLSHRAMPALATVAALLLLCWTLAQGTWRMLQPASPAMARAGGADLTDLRELGSVQLFGRAAPRSAAAETTSVAPSNLNMTLTGVAALPGDEATKERQSLFKNMVHTLNHNYVIDLIWQAHLEGREHGFAARNTPGHPPLAELWRKQQIVDDWYIAWSDKLSEAALGENVHFTLIGGNKGVMTRAEILLHIVNHTSYHRGFVADLFYQVPGARPPTTDLPVFLREGAAALA